MFQSLRVTARLILSTNSGESCLVTTVYSKKNVSEEEMVAKQELVCAKELISIQ